MGGGTGSKGKYKAAPSRAQRPTNAEDRSILDDLEGKVKVTSKRRRHDGGSSSGTASGLKDDDVDVDDDFLPDPYWSPTPYSAFKLLVSARFAAGLWTTISDCDEVYNYWEPTYYMLYGKGFQTWEYSPEFSLRSYTYILLHAVPAKMYDSIFKPTPLLIFFFIRCFLAFICASGEAYLYKSVRKKFGGNVARITLVTSLFSAGMFISSTAYLPSAFSMYMTAFAFGAWLDGLDELAIFATALSALLSWPFAALTGALIALDILLIRRKIVLFLKWALISLFCILIPVVVLDSNMYGKPVIAPWNIVKYNIFSNKGPDLYGVEPWSFYFINGALNFNLTFAFALAAPFLVVANYRLESNMKKKLGVVLTIFVWLGVFVPQPHKEERFLFPIFCLIPVGGAVGVDSLQKLVDLACSKVFLRWIQKVKDLTTVKVWDYRRIVSSIGVAALLTSSLLGASRILALHIGYRAPFDVYFSFNRDAAVQRAVESGRNYTLCYGKEWYRFPSAFFLPTPTWDVRFIESDFKGQLPNLYSQFDPQGTRRVPEHMNDWNREEPTRYVNVSSCDFLVDLADPERVSEKEPNYSLMQGEWRVLASQDFLNSAQSHPFFRAFYVPFFASYYTHYDPYVLLKRVRKKKAQMKKRGREFDEDDLI